MMGKSALIGILAVAIFFPILSFAEHYDIDPDHTSVNFTIKHLVISKVRGKFDKFSGSFDFDPQKPDGGKTNVTIRADSINTGTKERDKHLRSPDFFDVKKFPEISFVSTKVTDVTSSTAKLEGNLTIRGVTKPVVLNVELGGLATDPWGNKKAAFSASTKINRKDFGLNWNKAIEAGGVLVGDDVEISLEVEGLQKIKQAKN